MHNTISRRRAAKLIGAPTASAVLPIGTSRIYAADESRLMRSVPSTGEKLPVIGLGSAVTFDVRPGSPQLKPLGEVLAVFVKHGGKVIDSSPMYGNAEGVIGDLAAKANLRDSLFMATKVWTRGKEEGFVQINYSLVDRGAAQRILPLAQELRMAVIINRPFGGGGVLRSIAAKPLPAWAAEFDCHSWAQFLLKWFVSHPAVTCVIPATNNPQHLEDNMAAGVGRLPDAKTRQRMASLFVGF